MQYCFLRSSYRFFIMFSPISYQNAVEACLKSVRLTIEIYIYILTGKVDELVGVGVGAGGGGRGSRSYHLKQIHTFTFGCSTRWFIFKGCVGEK